LRQLPSQLLVLGPQLAFASGGSAYEFAPRIDQTASRHRTKAAIAVAAQQAPPVEPGPAHQPMRRQRRAGPFAGMVGPQHAENARQPDQIASARNLACHAVPAPLPDAVYGCGRGQYESAKDAIRSSPDGACRPAPAC